MRYVTGKRDLMLFLPSVKPVLTSSYSLEQWFSYQKLSKTKEEGKVKAS